MANQLIHLDVRQGAFPVPSCGATDTNALTTHDPLRVTCSECRPCSHAIAFLLASRDIAVHNFVTVEQVHCHCCSAVWKIP